jgi:hypothetical protein
MPTVHTETGPLGANSGAELAAPSWWTTPSWRALRREHDGEPIMSVLDVIVERLATGDDPLVLVGGTTLNEARHAAQDWIDHDIEPGEVDSWLDAGCYRADRVRDLIDAEVEPGVFLTDDGHPLVYDEELHGDGRPDDRTFLEVATLADYVMDGEIGPEQVGAVAARIRACPSTG